MSRIFLDYLQNIFRKYENPSTISGLTFWNLSSFFSGQASCYFVDAFQKLGLNFRRAVRKLQVYTSKLVFKLLLKASVIEMLKVY